MPHAACHVGPKGARTARRRWLKHREEKNQRAIRQEVRIKAGKASRGDFIRICRMHGKQAALAAWREAMRHAGYDPDGMQPPRCERGRRYKM